MSGAFAPGRKAWGICGRSGARALLKNLVFDGRFPNMRVLPDWFESRHPQETQKDLRDSIALYRPAPDNLRVPTTPVLAGEVTEGPAVLLSWSSSTSMVSLVTSYLLYRAIDDGEFELYATIPVERDYLGAITSANVYTDSAVETGTTYHYQIAAHALKGGDSARSNTVDLPVTTIHFVQLIDHAIEVHGATGSGDQEPNIEIALDGHYTDAKKLYLNLQASNGQALSVDGGAFSASSWEAPTEWWSAESSPTVSDYEARLVVLDGMNPVDGAATDAWTAMPDAWWYFQQWLPNADAEVTAEVELSIRNASTEEVLATSTLTIRFFNPA